MAELGQQSLGMNSLTPRADSRCSHLARHDFQGHLQNFPWLQERWGISSFSMHLVNPF